MSPEQDGIACFRAVWSNPPVSTTLSLRRPSHFVMGAAPHVTQISHERLNYDFVDFAAAFTACFVARTLVSDSGSTMSATDANDPSSP